ncbi:uncharacterized protein LOC143889344 [Tasmannia lanceolata]|uniref:uncharacterized protein LOC143889344 n=1 Tax=Tasmannia lanceolata TaxID=3420 RepID=UPI0040641A20
MIMSDTESMMADTELEISDIEPESPVIAEADDNEHDDSEISTGPIAEHLERQIGTSTVETIIVTEPCEADPLTESTDHRYESEEHHGSVASPVEIPTEDFSTLVDITEPDTVLADGFVADFIEPNLIPASDIFIEVGHGLVPPIAVMPIPSIQEEYVTIFPASLLIRRGSRIYDSTRAISSLSFHWHFRRFFRLSRAFYMTEFDVLPLLLLELLIYIFDPGRLELEVEFFSSGGE